MSCLDNLVTVGACDTNGTSGFSLMDAAGISQSVLAKIADDSSHSGMALALSKKNIAMLKVKNDFANVMAKNAVSSDLSTITYASGDITRDALALSSNYRGVVMHKATPSERIKKTYIKAIRFIPIDSGNISMRIEDGGEIHSYTIAAVGGVLNTIDMAEINDGADFEVSSSIAKVLFLDNSVQMYGSNITCMQGCNGRLPNPCSWVNGWDGTKYVKTDGFGISVEFYCECDYNEVLCSMSESIVGELIYIAWQIEIMQEHMMSGRFNNLVTYAQDNIKQDWLPYLKHEYSTKWDAFASNFKSLINRFNSDCVKCKGSRWVTNL